MDLDEKLQDVYKTVGPNLQKILLLKIGIFCDKIHESHHLAIARFFDF